MHDEKTRKKWRAHNRRRREAAKKAGICTTCIAREVMPGRSICRVCRAKRQNRAQAATS